MTLKNDYEIRGDTTVIFIKRRNGDVYECLIDTDDLPKARRLSVSLALTKKRADSQKMYVHFHKQLGFKKHTKRAFHRYLLDAPDGLVVDHINGNPLDNRRENLRLLTNAENMQNLNGPHRDSQTGIRGVSLDKYGMRYQVFIRIDKVTHYLGLYDTVEEANQVASDFRASHMPFSEDAREAA